MSRPESASLVAPAIPTAKSGSTPLAASALAALAASLCCVGPLVLVALGLGGAWAANLTLLEPYRPFFLGAAAVALAFAWRRIYRPAAACAPAEACALPAVRRGQRLAFWVVAALVLAAGASAYVAPLFY